MDKINILNKRGLLTSENRKEKLSHGCSYLRFESCIDLSEPVKVFQYGSSGEVTLQAYTRDIASFICWWTITVYKDLNGFSGFSNVKFEPVDFVVVPFLLK